MSSPLKSAPTLNSTTSALSNLTLNPPPSTADFSKISNAADEAEFATGLKTIKESDEAKGDEGTPEFIQENDEQERFMNSLFEEKNRSADKSPAPGDGSRAEYAHALSAAKNEKLSIRDFEIISELGSGNYGKVLLVKKKKDGSVFAMKVLQKQRVIEKKQVAHTMTERNVLAIVSKKNPHPYLISLHYAFQSSKRLYFIMDYCAGGELFFHLDKWDKFSEQMAKFYCAQVALALGHLHSLNIIYRDLKPENVLLDIDGNIRLADFGLSKISLGNEGANTLCGTAEYLAPETLMGHRYYAAIDWWALGVLVYELTTGLPPFRDPQRNCKLIYEKILKVDYDLPPFLSEECKDIIKRLLIADPEKRLGTKGDLSEIKSHPFFKDIDWDKLLKKQLTPPYKPIVNSIDDTSNFHSTPSAGFLVSSTVLANRASAAAAASNPAIMNPAGGAGHQRRHTKAEEFKHFSFNENDYPNVK